MGSLQRLLWYLLDPSLPEGSCSYSECRICEGPLKCYVPDLPRFSFKTGRGVGSLIPIIFIAVFTCFSGLYPLLTVSEPNQAVIPYLIRLSKTIIIMNVVMTLVLTPNNLKRRRKCSLQTSLAHKTSMYISQLSELSFVFLSTCKIPPAQCGCHQLCTFTSLDFLCFKIGCVLGITALWKARDLQIEIEKVNTTGTHQI